MVRSLYLDFISFFVQIHSYGSPSKKSTSRPSLSRIILSLESNAGKQRALQHILDGLQILHVREAVVSSLIPHSGNAATRSGQFMSFCFFVR